MTVSKIDLTHASWLQKRAIELWKQLGNGEQGWYEACRQARAELEQKLAKNETVV